MRYLFLLFAFVIISLSGCGGVSSLLQSNEVPSSLYRLNSKPPQVIYDTKGIKTNVLTIAKPDMPAGFIGKKITLYFDNGRRQEYYAGAEWADHLEDIVQEFIVKIASESYPQIIVDKEDKSELSPHYTLHVSVLDLQPEYDQTAQGLPQLHTQLHFRLLDNVRSVIVSDFVLNRQQKVEENTLGIITSGLESQLQSVLEEGLSILNSSDSINSDKQLFL